MDLVGTIPQPQPEEFLKTVLNTMLTQQGPKNYPRTNEGFLQFWGDYYESGQFNPIVLDTIVKMSTVNFVPWVSKFFIMDKFDGGRTVHSKFEYDLSPTEMGVRKVLGRTRAMKRIDYATTPGYKSARITMDYYFLKKPGGLEEYKLKLQDMLSNLERSLLLVAVQEMTRCPMARKSSDQRAQGHAGIRTVSGVMKNRRLKWGLLDKNHELGFEEIVRDVNAMFSQLVDPSLTRAKTVLAHPFTILNAMIRNPRLISTEVMGAEAGRSKSLWALPTSFGGLEIQTVPDVEPNIKNLTTETMMNHLMSTGSTFVFTNSAMQSGAVPPERFMSYMTTVMATDSVTNGWRRYSLRDAYRNSVEFDENGELDTVVMNQLIHALTTTEPRESYWVASKLRDNERNRRTANIYLKYVHVEGGKGKTTATSRSQNTDYTIVRRIGDMSELVLSDTNINYIYRCMFRAMTEDFSDEDMRELSRPINGEDDSKNWQNKLSPRLLEKITNRLEELIKSNGDDEYVPDNLIEVGATRPAFINRVEKIMEFDLGHLIAAMTVLLAPLNIATFDAFYDNNIALPFTMRASRPYETYVAESLIFTNGAKLGYMNYSGINSKSFVIEDPGFKQIAQEGDVSSGLTFVMFENMEYIPFVHIRYCVGGKGYKWVDQRKYTSMITDEERREYVIRQNHSWFGSFMAIDEGVDDSNEPEVITLTNVYDPMHFQSELEHSVTDFANQYDQPSFNGQAIFTTSGMFVNMATRGTNPAESFDDLCRRRLWNPYCCRITTRKFSPMSGNFDRFDEGHHILGPQIDNVRDRDCGRMNTRDYSEQNKGYSVYVENGNSHNKKLRIAQDYEQY